MMYVALAEAGVLAVMAISCAGVLRWLIRQQARERALLINQVCHLAGRPWQDAPHQPVETPEPELALVAIPEQWPE